MITRWPFQSPAGSTAVLIFALPADRPDPPMPSRVVPARLPTGQDERMASDPLQIPLDQLRHAFELALRQVEASAGNAVTLERDYFWSVPGDELYDVLSEPSALTIGQLSESWQHLEALLADEGRAVGYHLVWLADVIRAIGQNTVS